MEKKEGSSLEVVSGDNDPHGGADDKASSSKCDEIRELKHPTSGKQLFACNVCDKVFFSQCSVRSHLELHRGDRSFVCGICNKVLLSQNELVRHRQSHTFARPHHCTDCGKTFADKSNLVRHQLVHKGEKRFVCAICGKAFLRRSNLTVHHFTHTTEKPYTCQVCGDGFTNKRYLLSHQQAHNEESSFVCSVCRSDFTSRESLAKHQLTCRSNERANEEYTCDIRGKVFSEPSSLSNHKKTRTEYVEGKTVAGAQGTHSPPAPKQMESGDQAKTEYDSNISAKPLPDNATLQRPQLTHFTPGSHAIICQICGESFDTTADLKRHETIHNNKDQLFVCGVCGKGFTKLHCLRTHQRIHQKETGHKCNDCGKVFAQKRILLSHQRGHCSQASYISSQTFSSPNDLEAHTPGASQNSP